MKSENLLLYKKAILDDEGKSEVQFETALIDEVSYTIYIRDTEKTSSIPISVIAKEHYDLKPNNGYAKLIQAHDDILLEKKI